ncbi:MAG TPA: GNAT family N-acetyltransferase [Polyangiaceae bacterium]|nr:GNAT family N-acetyltransferase [Polyangiaceae bacterium]
MSELETVTMGDQITLRLPREDEESEFLHAHRATSPEVPYFLHYYVEGMAFRDYLRVLVERRLGVNVSPNFVPATFLFAFLGSRIIGRISIRHSLNEQLERVGGHIGYVVVPEFRRRGHATEILRQGLRIARAPLGIERVLLTCDDDNIGSIRTIEKNGGTLENIIVGADLSKPKRRYWIASG